MKNYNLKLLKKSAKSILHKNYKIVASLMVVFTLLWFVPQTLFQVLGFTSLPGQTLLAVVVVLVSGPFYVGILNVYYKLSKKKPVSAKSAWDWYTDGKKLKDSLQSVLWFCGTLLMWFSIYVLFPVAMVYMIWGQNLLAFTDPFLIIGTFMVVFAAVVVVAFVPYALHMMRYTGGLFLTAQESHLTVSMRYPIGKDFIKPHIYRYALLQLTIAPYFLAALIPMGFALFNWTAWGMLTPIIMVTGTLFISFYALPYSTIASLMLFERMQKPKESIPYVE